MIQQVNLYKGILKQKEKQPVLKNYLYGLLAIIIILTSYSLFLLVDINNTKNTITTTNQQLIEAEFEVQHLRVKFPKKPINKLLIQELSHSQKMLSNLSQVVHLLNDKTSDQTQGFSLYFSALARQSITDIWLTTISINSLNNTISLQGSTYKPESTAIFLQKLHHEKVFQGRAFTKLVMSQSEKDENLLNFIIDTTIEPEEDQQSHD